jgi:hypothetical protein
MRNKLSILILFVAFLSTSAQVATHDLIFEADQVELTAAQKQELSSLMGTLIDKQKLTIFPVLIDKGNSKYVFDKNARDQAQAIAEYAKELGFELMGTPSNFPTNHQGLSASVIVKYHKPMYLDAGEEPYSLQANYPEKPSQFFIIDPLKDTTIYGIEGTIIHIPARGLTGKEKVEVELKEFYSLADLMVNDLSTVSNGQMIETGGSIYLNAKEQKSKRAVNINQQLGLDVAFTNGKEDKEMQIFIKDPTSKKMNWIVPRTPKVTHKWSMTEIILDAEGNEISSTKYNSKEEWQAHLKNEEAKKKAEEEKIAKQQENYEKLKVYDLGYINCDKFYDEPKMLFTVVPDSKIVAEYFMVFNDTRGVLKGSVYGGEVSFGSVPKDKNATLYAVSFSGDKAYFYKKGVIASGDKSTRVELQPVDKSYVDAQLAMLK